MKFKNISEEKAKVLLPTKDKFGRKVWKTVKPNEVFEVEFGIGQEAIFKKSYRLDGVHLSLDGIKNVLPKVETKVIKEEDLDGEKELSAAEKRAITIARKKAEKLNK